MALFTDTRELDRQATNRQFNQVTGWKKAALYALGYKSDGTKNWYGKSFGHGNILLDHYAPKWIAGKDSDTGQVIDSAESEEWGKQMATAKFASELITLGATAGAGSAAGAAGASTAGTAGATAGATAGTAAGTTAATTAGTSTAAQVGTTGAVTAAGNTGQTMATQASENAAKNASMDALNSGYSEQTIDGVTTTNIGGVDLSEEDMANWQKYMEENPEGTIEDFQATQQGNKNENALKAMDKTKGIPLVGSLTEAIAYRPIIADKLRTTKRGITNQQNLKTFNYL